MLLAGIQTLIFFFTCLGPLPPAQAYDLFLPAPGTMVPFSPEFSPAYLKGIVVHPEDPFKFDFIIYKGDKPLNASQKKEEYTKLVKYFLASLAIPDNDQWVNLSPYEKDRIIKDDFGKTEMGRDLLAQDYMLKQITASLIYPESQIGREFWAKVYAQAQKQYGTTNIPVNTFNKVWILPDNAEIYEKGNTAYVLKNHLRVMLEEDYLSLQKHSGMSMSFQHANPYMSSPNALIGDPNTTNTSHTIASSIIRQIVLPELEREVNQDANFAPLRQVYSGMLLATWFKHTLRQSLLGQIYANKNKIRGVGYDKSVILSEAKNLKANNNDVELIYQRYLQAYKKGVFNFIKEDVDTLTNQPVPRKYFSGGAVSINWANVHINQAMTSTQSEAVTEEFTENKVDDAMISLNTARPEASAAMFSKESFQRAVGPFINAFFELHLDKPAYAYENDDKMPASWVSRQYEKFFPGNEKSEKSVAQYHFLLDLFYHQSVRSKSRGNVLYLGSGVDLGHVMLSTNGAVYDMVDLLVPSYKDFNKFNWNGDIALQKEFRERANYSGYGNVEYIKKSFSACLVAQLKSMGLTRKDITINRLENRKGFTISFQKEFPGEAQKQEYIFNFINSNIHDFIPDKTYDVLFQKSGWSYESDALSMQAFIRMDHYLKEGAFIFVNPYTAHSEAGDRWHEEFAFLERKSDPKLQYKRVTALSFAYTLIRKLQDIRQFKGYGYDLHIYQKVSANAAMERVVENNKMTADRAMLKGGIDLNSANLSLLIKRDGRGVVLPTAQQDLAQLSRLIGDGLEPQILSIKPASEASLFPQLVAQR